MESLAGSNIADDLDYISRIHTGCVVCMHTRNPERKAC
jgi:hypothetical protein